MHRALPLLLLCAAANAAEVDSPLSMAAALETRMAAGDGVTLPDPATEIVRHAGAIDLARGEWPAEFLARTGETVCVAVSPLTGNYEFFDESGDCFFTLVPVLPTTENWVAPFHHAEGGTSPDDDLYAPWRLVDVWTLSHAESAKAAELNLDLRFLNNGGQLRFVNNPDPTNLCFTAFAYTATNLYFTAAWPTNEPLPDATLDLYGSTNLLDPRWLFLSSHPATNPPAEFIVAHASLPWYVAPTQHVHDASCESITNIVASPLDGITIYTNTFWSCSTNRTPSPPGLFRLGTRLDTDGDGLTDAAELLVHGTRPDRLDSDGDGVPDGIEPSLWWSNPLWATNAEDADFIVDLVAPTDGSAETVLTMDGLRIPLSPAAGPWYFKLPPGQVVSCSASSSGSFFVLWCGAPGGSFLDPDTTFEKPLWTDGIENIAGYHTGPGSCSLAVPVLTIEPVFPPEDPTNSVAGMGSHWTDSGSICVHEPDGILRYTWNISPAIVGQGRQPVVTGPLRLDSAGLYADVSGTTGEQEGAFELADTRLPLSGNLWGPLYTNVVDHRCTATYQVPYCSVCGRYEGNDLAVEVYLVSNRRMTLKHDNTAVFLLGHPSSSDEVFQSVHFEIIQDGQTEWMPLSGAVWTARIAGRFHLRAVVETVDGHTVPSGTSPLIVQFPSEEEMIADPVIAAHATNLWEQTLSLCTPTSRCELGCWILLDTATDTYLFTTTTNGPPTPNDTDSYINLLPNPGDNPLFPKLGDGSAIYEVGSLHTHTPTQYRTGLPRLAGPSPDDENASRSLSMPGLVFDYVETTVGSGTVRMGTMTNAPARLYPTMVCPRRPWGIETQ